MALAKLLTGLGMAYLHSLVFVGGRATFRWRAALSDTPAQRSTSMVSFNIALEALITFKLAS
jgi:hypothetical protein